MSSTQLKKNIFNSFATTLIRQVRRYQLIRLCERVSHTKALQNIRRQTCSLTLAVNKLLKNLRSGSRHLRPLRTLAGTYHLRGKTGNSGSKIKWSRHSLWKASENMDCDLRRCNAPLFFCSADLNIQARIFFHDVIFYSLMFMHKISTPVICVNCKYPRAARFQLGQLKS